MKNKKKNSCYNRKEIICYLLAFAAIVILLILTFWDCFGRTRICFEHHAEICLSNISDVLIAEDYSEILEIIIALSVKIGIAFAVSSILISILISRKNKIYAQKVELLNTLTANIPGGVICCNRDEDFSMRFISDGFCTLTGYTKEEILLNFDNKFAKIVYPKDRESIKSQVLNNKKQFLEVTYRVIRKDGVIIWVFSKSQMLTNHHDEYNYYCVLLDITDTKRAENELAKSRRELELSNERYKIILEQSESAVFEYDFNTKKISYNNNHHNKFDFLSFPEDFPDSVLAEKIIHPDDIERFTQFYKKAINGARTLQDEHRIMDKDGNYIWCNVRATTIFDHNGTPLKVIGQIEDISKQKAEALRLITNSQIDRLTNILNKETTQDFIESALKNFHDVSHAMIILDIDNFKTINNTFGHQRGDEFLIEFSKKLELLFRSTDIIGRTGGDRFIVLVKNSSKEMIDQKCREIHEMIGSIRIKDDKTLRITCSMGVEISGENCHTYNELFTAAEEALLSAKNLGKNQHVFAKKQQI
ncbi:MAG: diguanylate cyclase [Oscillospiraceae bacterium]